MPNFTDRTYLLNEQYKTAANLNQRIALHTRFSTNPYGWFKWVFDQFHLPAQCRLLELGCGSGDLWLQNLSRLPPAWRVYLSDLSGGMVRQARENLAGLRQACGFARIDAQALPFQEGNFDAVIANHMLHHVPDRREALAEIHRALRPGGKLYATTMGVKHLVDIQILIDEFDPDLVTDAIDVATLFTLENGVAQLSEFFVDIRLNRYVDSLRVTEASPLADYIFSTSRLAKVQDKRHELLDFLERILVENEGVIMIMKDSGIFEACKSVG